MNNRAQALIHYVSTNVFNAKEMLLHLALALHAVSALLGVLFKWMGDSEDTRSIPKSMCNYRAVIGPRGFFPAALCLLFSCLATIAGASPAPQQSDYKTTTCYASSRLVAASSCASLAPAGRWRLVGTLRAPPRGPSAARARDFARC